MIFLLCPPHVATGGPESLHLLARELGRAGHDARMTYIPPAADATHPEYAGYDIRTALAIEDRPGNVVIAPEIWSWRLNRPRAARRVVWWLSVDNYLATGSPFDFSAPANADVSHLVGSAYARVFVEGQGARQVAALSSYVHELFHAPATAPREDVVAYNPRKGAEVVARLREVAPDLGWRPLEGLTREGVGDALRRAKVYVDFGHHPGKERLPREAAAAGCCVVTGMKGSAGFAEDVPIPPAYKFDDRRPLDQATLGAISETIRACLGDYQARRADFEAYRELVRGEKAVFEAAVRALFPG